ncbi:putative methyltransferase-like protein 15P1 [Centruroides sculpturatus]|uniref:putative methyltransferase-like protein 15P1 n=1 Tax=Centruroides sculpturatus TaxID=218467 RepID=UPI000C6E7216|nr:putative methyltransferase-like protein 15P1 [Centruroides sculpturatus]
MNKLAGLLSNACLIKGISRVSLVRNCSTVEKCKPEKMLHVPVMSREVIEFLDPEEGQTYIDMTFGAGGHSKQILDCGKNIKLFALDRDPTAYREAKKMAEVHK